MPVEIGSAATFAVQKTVLIAAAVVSLFSARKAVAQVRIEDLNGDDRIRILAFGDSITEGSGDGPSCGPLPGGENCPNVNGGYTKRLQDELDAAFDAHSNHGNLRFRPQVIEEGEGGEDTGHGLERFQDLLPGLRPRPDIVMILEGANNAANNFQIPSVPGHLGAMVDLVNATGALPILGTLTPVCCDESSHVDEVDSINAGIRALTQPLTLAEIFFAFTDGNSTYTRHDLIHEPDGLHPTKAGHTQIFNVFFDQLEFPLPNGIATVGLYRRDKAKFAIRNINSAGNTQIKVKFGSPGGNQIPLSGDWNHDGKETIGVWDPGPPSVVHLRNTSSAAIDDKSFGLGEPGFLPIAGDWNGDTRDSIGFFDPETSEFHLRNKNTNGPFDFTFVFGSPPGPGFLPIAGDWDGSGTDRVGLYDPQTGTFFLKTSANSAGDEPLGQGFPFGVGGGKRVPITGDWDGNGTDTIGVYNPAQSTFSLRNSNSEGAGEVSFKFANPSGWIPVAGDWNGS